MTLLGYAVLFLVAPFALTAFTMLAMLWMMLPFMLWDAITGSRA